MHNVESLSSSAESSEFYLEKGSFRDPKNFVFYQGDRVLRAITYLGKDDYLLSRENPIFQSLIERKKIISEKEINKEGISFLNKDSKIFKIIEHPRINFISYPYEWPFHLLKKAALHHLELHLALLDAKLTLSDATAYNIQFIGIEPIHIDSLSIRPYKDGEFWAAYRQFCEQFLNPLLLYSKCRIPFNSIYKGYFEGISSDVIYKILPFYQKCSPSIFLHVFLPLKLQSVGHLEKKAINLKKNYFSIASYQRLLVYMRDWIEKIYPPTSEYTIWGTYEKSHSYDLAEEGIKMIFISRIIAAEKPHCVWDIGCNAGKYSLLAIEAGAGSVIGFDFDHKAIDLCAQRSEEKNIPFLPLIMDMTNPSPALGWANEERKTLFQRKNADFIVCLAFIHHMVIGKNISLENYINWILSLANQGIIEFISKEDPMVHKMLLLREDIFPDYSFENFKQILSRKAQIIEIKKIKETRQLIFYKVKENLK
jgi:ribosomal protein L11 methylase PrmA